MNQTPIQIIMIVIVSEAILAGAGVISLCLSLFYKTYADPAILTALIAITSGLVGSLSTILTNTRQITSTPPEIKVANTPGEPVPVTTQP